MPKPEIFFSYAWNDPKNQEDNREKIVDDLCAALKLENYPVVRDKEVLKYKGLIPEFEQRIGRSKFIIVVISDRYLKSSHCMYEFLEIYRKSNSEIKDTMEKIFPLVLEDARISSPEDRLAYVSFWKSKEESLRNEIGQVGLDRTIDVSSKYKIYKEVAGNIALLTGLLNDMNTLSIQQLSADNFDEIKKAVKLRAKELEGTETRATFNEFLTRNLLEAISPHNESAKKFLANALTRSAEWEKNEIIRSKAMDIISSSFPGFLSIQLNQLWSIGKEKSVLSKEGTIAESSETKEQRYIEHCIFAAKRTLQLLYFVFLSKLWDYKKSTDYSVPENYSGRIKYFFETNIEPDLAGYLELLKIVVAIYAVLPGASVFDELDELQKALEEKSDFSTACSKLQAISDSLSANEFTLAKCNDAETQLSVFFTVLSFLSFYKMVSIKNIGYYQMRNTMPHYLHNYTVLGIYDHQTNVPQVRYAETPFTTDVILLYKKKYGDRMKENYGDGINLFPFMIDMNALNFENGTKICFYSERDIDDDGLKYTFYENNNIEKIKPGHILKPETNMDELMMNIESQKMIKTDTIVQQFEEAKNMILSGMSGV